MKKLLPNIELEWVKRSTQKCITTASTVTKYLHCAHLQKESALCAAQ